MKAHKTTQQVSIKIHYALVGMGISKPNRLYSPHTVFMRQSGQSYELATALCSLLLGLDYDAYVVSGYATRDVTMRIMARTDNPYPPKQEVEEIEETKEVVQKYIVKPPRDLRSQFLLMMEQREIDKEIAEQERIHEEIRKMREEEEQPPYDDLYGMRVHGWVMLLPGIKDIENPIFIEPSTGYSYSTDTPLYCGIESVWNHQNYWVNMQDCSEGLGNINYDLAIVKNWEHLLIGEPAHRRESNIGQEMEDEEKLEWAIQEEKHLDVPAPWSLPINIPHDVIQKRFPGGKKETQFKRTIVEEYAPYVQIDGLITRIKRYDDMDCMELLEIEERYENRHACCMKKRVFDCSSDWVTDYFREGREDAVIKHKYHFNDYLNESERTIEFNYGARHDSLSKLEITPVQMTEHYIDREDFFYYRQISFAERGKPPAGMVEGPRRIVTSIIEKFYRDVSKPASNDIAIREFAVIDREIHLKYHYDKGKVTASTRDFIKPPLAEMGESMKFNPELTFGYQAEIGAKPPRQLQLFLLFEEQLKEEELSLRHAREMDDQITEFLQLRFQETDNPKLDVSLFDREQNVENRRGMLEKEKLEREHKEKEIEEDIDYIAPYLEQIGNPKTLTYDQAMVAREKCLIDFKQMLVHRANDIQSQFDNLIVTHQEKQMWFLENQDNMKAAEEEAYYEEMNDRVFNLHALEIRLARHRELSPYRYEALLAYLRMDSRLSILHR